jgi:hypothetical protein
MSGLFCAKRHLPARHVVETEDDPGHFARTDRRRLIDIESSVAIVTVRHARVLNYGFCSASPCDRRKPHNQRRHTMADKTKKTKWTAAQVREAIKNVEKAVQKFKRENKQENVTVITAEEVEKKLKRVNSPMIISQAWNDAAAGGTVNYNLGIFNPDPVQSMWLFAHVWVGSGNVDATVGTFLSNVDTRFPRLTQPNFDGLTLAAGASATLSFALKVPSGMDKTEYLGNSCLMQLNWHDVGTYLDRGVFVFTVS